MYYKNLEAESEGVLELVSHISDPIRDGRHFEKFEFEKLATLIGKDLFAASVSQPRHRRCRNGSLWVR